MKACTRKRGASCELPKTVLKVFPKRLWLFVCLFVVVVFNFGGFQKNFIRCDFGMRSVWGREMPVLCPVFSPQV